MPLYIDITDGMPEKRIVRIEYSEVLLEMAVACIQYSVDVGEQHLSQDLANYVENWRKEVKLEKSVFTETEGSAGLQLKAWFGWLREQVKSGGKTRKTFEEALYKDVNEFIELLNRLTAELEQRVFGRKPLCILDGLDHVDVKPCEELFANYGLTIMRPRVSKLFIVPLYLLNTRVRATIDEQCSVLHNIKVFEAPGTENLSTEGYAFFQDLISRYAPLDWFDEEALKSLFELSAGVVRDMIRFTGDACQRAYEAGSERVTMDHVKPVWYSMMRYFEDVLKGPYYAVLHEVAQNPNPKGLDDLSSLLFLKAIVRYPNGLGWYGVHPAAQRLLEKV